MKTAYEILLLLLLILAAWFVGYMSGLESREQQFQELHGTLQSVRDELNREIIDLREKLKAK